MKSSVPCIQPCIQPASSMQHSTSTVQAQYKHSLTLKHSVCSEHRQTMCGGRDAGMHSRIGMSPLWPCMVQSTGPRAGLRACVCVRACLVRGRFLFVSLLILLYFGESSVISHQSSVISITAPTTQIKRQ